MLQQAVRDAVGLGIQFGITQSLSGEFHRDGVGVLRGLRLEQADEGFIVGVVGFGGVPSLQLPPPGLVQQQQAMQRGIRMGNDAAQQGLELPAHPGNRRLVEQVGGVFPGGLQLPGLVRHRQAQVEFGDWIGLLLQGHVQPRQVQKAVHPVLHREHDLEQRAVAEAALRLELLDQMLERDVLVGVGIQAGLPRLLQQIGKTGRGVDLGA